MAEVVRLIVLQGLDCRWLRTRRLALVVTRRGERRGLAGCAARQTLGISLPEVAATRLADGIPRERHAKWLKQLWMIGSS